MALNNPLSNLGQFSGLDTSQSVQDNENAEFNVARGDPSGVSCETGKDIEYYDGAKCRQWPYQISHMQVGTGASSIPGDVGEESSSVVVLGRPLTRKEYGGPGQSMLLEPHDHMIYSDIDVPIERQTVAKVGNQGVITSSLISVIVLDEQTANGQSINEVGLFVNNPYVVTGTPSDDYDSAGISPGLLGDPITGSVGDINHPSSGDDKTFFDPGNLLAAYRKFNPIDKEPYFSLLIRWAVSFTEDCDA